MVGVVVRGLDYISVVQLSIPTGPLLIVADLICIRDMKWNTQQYSAAPER